MGHRTEYHAIFVRVRACLTIFTATPRDLVHIQPQMSKLRKSTHDVRR